MSKSGFLRGLIIKDSGIPPTNEVAAIKVATEGPPIKNAVSVQGVLDNKFIDLLEGVIEKNNLPGQDYFEFKQATENMKSLAMDEKTKFQTVYTVLSLQGCKKDILVSSLDKYIAIIQEEKANFDKEMNSQFAAKVQSKLDEIERSKKELEALSKKLTDLNGTILNLSQEAQAEEMKIRATEANFKASADIVISEMVADKEKINNFIV